MILRSKIAVIVALSLLAHFTDATEPSASSFSASDYLAKADSLLSQGQFQDAIKYYDNAVKSEPDNYLSIFKRGATYLSLGRLQPALADFDRVLDLKPELDAARMQRARLRLKLGQWQGAKDDFANTSGQQQVEHVKQVEAAEQAAADAARASSEGDIDSCIGFATEAITAAPAAMNLRVIRSDCRLAKGLIQEAVADLTHVVVTSPLQASTHVKIARLQFAYLNDRDRALAQVKKCLHYDPDAAECKKTFREFKKLDKDIVNATEFKDGKRKRQKQQVDDELLPVLARIETVTADIEKIYGIKPGAEKELQADYLELICDVFYDLKLWDQGSKFSKRLLQARPESLVGLLLEARVRLNRDEFDSAIELLTEANQHSGGQNQRVTSLLHEAQILQRRASAKDYYKVLGVDRHVSDKEIKRAYRSKTKEFHPDKYRGDLKPDQVEKKMAEINEAYEVLSTPELKERFDNGDDPNDHSQPGGNGAGHGGFGQQHPFFRQYQYGSAGSGGGRQYYRQQQNGPGSAGSNYGFKFHF
ncbi:hypothetical protein V1514DRAFT_336747 [Lipomyces japonicus]|uniref:uncharacterized protein n=1 Tax=Lipomyces japonicus TaxID=56871 RepID=UPI0034CF91BD